MITARIWREQPQRYRNEGTRCEACGAVHFPRRTVCDGCGSRDLATHRVAETGTVLTHTVIRVAPSAFAAEVPYVVGVIEMDDGARMMAQIADVEPEEVKTGMRVRLEFRKVRQYGRTGVISYAHKAVPV